MNPGNVTIAPDSAWRQLRHHTKRRDALNTAEPVDNLALDAAERNVDACRNVWLQSLFDAFEHQMEKAKHDNKDTLAPATIYEAGLPCIDCLMPLYAPAQGHRIRRDQKHERWHIYAKCGGKPIDPAATPMPEVKSTWP